MRLITSLFLILILSFSLGLNAEEKKKDDIMSSATFSGLKFRNLGPAIASGRIIDIAMTSNYSTYYVAVASGNVWKTTNAGISWKPIFDNYGSYSIGCITVDPSNENIVWVGSGENNSQRAVNWGDGVYKSEDGGKSFKNVGLKKSEHIGKILVDPRNSNVVYVAAQGPLWGDGGDRGLYKSTDGGKTWEKSLYISEKTGVSDIAFDPRNPDVIYASSYQRRRHVWTLINGGPESALYKSEDAGKTWNKLTKGIPAGDIGRIGIAVSPVNPDYIYAMIEAEEGKGGFFRSTDRGASFSKMNSYFSGSPQYYQEIIADPFDENKVYSMDTYSKYTVDGGKTWINIGLKERHVDDHAIWIDPNDPNHWLIGGDGGLYETYDHSKTWRFFENLPITQFYRVEVDNTEPFYYVYGGTQDNATIGGPSRTVNAHGIMNQNFYFTKSGDGFQTRVDPKNPDIVYSQAQYGSLIRFDRKSGERVELQPAPGKGEMYRWNWDAPLIISPHKHTRLYFAANVLFKSEDRGDSWEVISPDLSRQLDRNQLEVFGEIQKPDAVAKNKSTSLYGNIVSLSESPVKEGLLYVGTDDGLIQVSEDGGKNWRKFEKFPGLGELVYISDIFASQHDENVVYATIDNHKMNDFKPYIYKSTDKGKTWKSISNNLPKHHPVLTVYEDHVEKDLLFAGTEFGLFFSRDGGNKWIQLKAGLPTIAVKDIEIQKRENDIVLATFGRGFYILDDYTALRSATKEVLNKEAHIFPVRDAWLYTPNTMWGRRNLGENFYREENPYGAFITYYIKENIKTKKQLRKEAEKDAKNYKYPSFEDLKAEDLEDAPYLLFTITDEYGQIVKKMKTPARKGLHRLNWKLDAAELYPIEKSTKVNKNSKFKIIPGSYFVSMSKVVNGVTTKMIDKVEIKVKSLNNATLPAKDKKAMFAFQTKVRKMMNAIYGTNSYLNDLGGKAKKIEKSILMAQVDESTLIKEIRDIQLEIRDIKILISGDPSISKRAMNQTQTLMDRINGMIWFTWHNTAAPTKTYDQSFAVIESTYKDVVTRTKSIKIRVEKLERKLNKINAPWTPGRIIETID